jgi:phenylacetate-CoA ligase
LTYAVRRGLVFGFLHVAKWVRLGLLALPHAERLLRPGMEPLLWRLGEWRLWLAVEGARKRVPAYRRFLAEHGDPRVTLRGFRPDFSALPVTDKESYVRRFGIEERCRDGRLPMRGAVIDESSGTSGEPNNWVRGLEERADGRKLLHMGLRQAFGDEPLFALNAFALGPWATGMAVSMAVVDVAVVKSVGPDIGKIEKTLRLFGPRYRYLLLGYPPFLKRLVDEADLDWSRYRVAAVVGGEGMSESLRGYLLRSFDRVYSSFGASDLEINLAGENDFTIAVRRLLLDRPELGRALGLPEHGSLPMVFQYNPLDYFVESSPDGELIVSICRVGTAAPKLRYNLHDLGAVVRFPVLRQALAELGLKPADLVERPLDLPLLFHWGRSDSTVAFYGANIGPADRRPRGRARPSPSRQPGLPRGCALHPRGRGTDGRVPPARHGAVRRVRRSPQAALRHGRLRPLDRSLVAVDVIAPAERPQHHEDGQEADYHVDDREHDLHADAEAEQCRGGRFALEHVDEQRLLGSDAARCEGEGGREAHRHLDEQDVLHVRRQAERLEEEVQGEQAQRPVDRVQKRHAAQVLAGLADDREALLDATPEIRYAT